MKHEGPPGGTPYREPANPDAETLERMRKQIEAEGKRGILLPEGIKNGDEIPEFANLLKKKIDPNNIVFYSPTTGILKQSISPYYPSYPSKNKIEYAYKNGDDPTSSIIVIEYNKKIAKLKHKSKSEK